MAGMTRFASLSEAVAEKGHNFQSDTLRVMLTNTAPAVGNQAKADITEIAAGNGYAAGGPQVAVNSSAQIAGTYKLVLADSVITAGGGPVGPFRYVVLYNATSGLLIGWWDYGASITLADKETFTVDFDDAAGVVVIA